VSAGWRVPADGDAFRAGGYEPAVAGRFIARLQDKIAEGRRVGETAAASGGVAPWLPSLVLRGTQ
jgi:hypothetical protein